MTTYTMSVTNYSELAQGSPKFAIVAELPEARNGSALSTAWLTQVIHPGNTYTFTWDINWGFAWSASGAVKDYQWTAHGSLEADPASAAQCAAQFDYVEGDFLLRSMTRDPDPAHDKLWISNTGSVPTPSVQPSSVAITLDGQPACVVEAGPNITQRGTLHPRYHILAGNLKKCQMLDMASYTDAQLISYDNGVQAKTVVLDDKNNWHVANGEAVDPGTVLNTPPAAVMSS
ncbi:hypothetical protein [Actinomadura latina]|uniref:Uncharacterized protein n=1 Tax=Actinomadura latina TaxID=163603 RepID=A0A846ZAY9_9ACTN|nr:hypothetical protein [Actinomadura latina]NKZ07146.1 hypothetical protein [Actinomadura latina]